MLFSKSGTGIAIVLVIAWLLALSAPLSAGTLPNISGTWYANGNTSKRCSISQSGTSVTLTNEQGRTASGHFVNPGEIDTNWGYFGGSNIRGTISNDLRRIDWSNGTYWTRESAPKPAPTPNPYRSLQFATSGLTPTRAPIVVLDGWGAVKRDGKAAIVCISFKNENPVAATHVVIEFPLTTKDGETLETLRLDRRGEFSTNVEIHGWPSLADWQGGIGHRGYSDNCAGQQARLAAMSLLSAHFAGYRVERVEFADGTIWPER